MPQVALRTAGPRRDDRFHPGKALPLPLPRGPRVSKQGSAQNRGTCLPPPRPLPDQFPCPFPTAHEPHQRRADREGTAGRQHDAREHRKRTDRSDQVVTDLHENEMTQIDAEGQRCQTREPSAWFQPQFPHDEKDRERHQKDVDARKVPNDLEVGVVARKAALHGQIAECRDRIAGREHRDAERERTPPAPCRRYLTR